MELIKALNGFKAAGIECVGIERPELNGWQIVCVDDNDHPFASVIQHKYSYGSDDDKLEVGFLEDAGELNGEDTSDWLDKNGQLVRGEDVIGWLTLEEAIDLVKSKGKERT